MQVQHTSFRLGLPDLHVTHVAEATDGTWLVWVQGMAQGATCPRCSAWTNRIHQRRRQGIDDLPASGRPVFLLLTKRRWRCGHCDHVFGEVFPSVARYQRMTERYQQALYRSVRKRPTTAVAEESGVGSGRVQRLLERLGDQEVNSRPEAHPRFLGVDEFAAKRGQVYNTVFVDLEHRKILEVVETREKQPVRAQLEQYRGSVEAVCIDLNEAFRVAVRKALPGVKVVADKFHVIRLVQWALNAVRRRVRRQFKGKRNHPLFRSRWLLLSNYEDIPAGQRRLLHDLLALSPDLRMAYAAKERLRAWYRTSTADNSYRRLDRLIGWLITSMVPELMILATTLRYWEGELTNYHTYRISNSITEGLNNKIKVTKRQAYGFRSFRNFRRKILLAC